MRSFFVVRKKHGIQGSLEASLSNWQGVSFSICGNICRISYKPELHEKNGLMRAVRSAGYTVLPVAPKTARRLCVFTALFAAPLLLAWSLTFAGIHNQPLALLHHGLFQFVIVSFVQAFAGVFFYWQFLRQKRFFLLVSAGSMAAYFLGVWFLFYDPHLYAPGIHSICFTLSALLLVTMLGYYSLKYR